MSVMQVFVWKWYHRTNQMAEQPLQEQLVSKGSTEWTSYGY